MVAERGATYAVTPQEESQRARIADSVETTLKLGGGVILVSVVGGEERMYSEHFACVYDGISLEELAPRSFSFNSPHGACPECTGLGTKLEIDESLVVTNPDLSIAEGAILPWSRFASTSTWYTTLLAAVAERYGFSLETPWRDMSDEAQRHRPARHRRQHLVLLSQPPGRAPPAFHHLRGRDSEPGAALQGRLGERARGYRAVHVGASPAPSARARGSSRRRWP